MEYILFIIGLVLIIKGGDYFVDASCNIAKRFHISEILIGATIVSIGTTLPEFLVSTSSALKGISSVSYGNAIGTVICNTSFVCAIPIIFAPTKVDKKPLILPTLFFFIAAMVYAYNAYVYKGFTRLFGILMLVVFVVYMSYNVYIVSHIKTNIITKQLDKIEEKIHRKIIFDFIILIVSAIAIGLGANLMVDNGVIIAKNLGVKETVIALTVIALGTSLPELVTAINALLKGHSALSLGNIIGANLFNIIYVSGASIAILPFKIPDGKLFMGYPSSLLIDLPFMFLGMIILTVPTLIKGKLYRTQGIILMILYISYILFQYFY